MRREISIQPLVQFPDLTLLFFFVESVAIVNTVNTFMADIAVVTDSTVNSVIAVTVVITATTLKAVITVSGEEYEFIIR